MPPKRRADLENLSRLLKSLLLVEFSGPEKEFNSKSRMGYQLLFSFTHTKASISASIGVKLRFTSYSRLGKPTRVCEAYIKADPLTDFLSIFSDISSK